MGNPISPELTLGTFIATLALLGFSGCQAPADSPERKAAEYNRQLQPEKVVDRWKATTEPHEFKGDLNDPKLVDILPIPISMEQPSLPKGARGKVTLDFVVTSEGEVTRITVVESPSEQLSQLAIQALSHWKFKPGTIKGRPVAVLLRIPIDFGR